jgi:outer membrane lipoprotein-sorting protein
MCRPLSRAAVITAALFLVVTPSQAQTLDDIIASNLKSKGGLDKLRATTTVKMTGRMTVQGTEIPITTWAKRPNLVRREATMAGQTVVNAFDGTTLWRAVGTGPAEPLPGPQAAYAQQESEFDSVFVDYKQRGHTIELVGKEKIDGREAHHLKVTRKGGPPQDYHLDAETGLEMRITMSLNQGGNPTAVVTELSDYRDVDGRMVPFSVRQIVNGKPAASTTLEKVEFNVPVDDAFFRMPSK